MYLLTIVCFSLFLAAFSAVPGWAKGIFIEPGARDASMGAAMTAVADDATAVYYNPAGLAQLKDSGVEMSCFFLNADAKSSKSLNNSLSPVASNGDFPLPIPTSQLAQVEPSSYQSRTFSTNAQVPFVGGYNNINGITYALSVYGIGGGGGQWRDSTPALYNMGNIKSSIDGSYAFIIYNLSAAKKLTSQLMLGLGIDMVNMIDNTNAQKYFRGTTINYSEALDEGAAGYGIQVNGGLMYMFSDKVKGGLVLRSGTNIKLSGQAKLNGNESAYDEEYTYPLTYAVGASYDPRTDLTLAFSIGQNNYSSMHENVTYKSNIGLPNSSGPLEGRDWKDTTQVHIGAEYRCTGKLALRAGIENDPTPFSTNQLTLTELNQYNYIYYCIGAGYKIGQVNLDLNYCYCPSDNPSIGDRNYTYNLDVFRLDARYSF